MAPKAEKKTWYVQREGWVLDEYRKVNDIVEATDAEVQYLVAAGNLGPEKVERPGRKAAAPAPDTSLTAETPASKAVAEKKTA